LARFVRARVHRRRYDVAEEDEDDHRTDGVRGHYRHGEPAPRSVIERLGIRVTRRTRRIAREVD
jgi:hypothetical protein